MSRMIMAAFSDEYALPFEQQLDGMKKLHIGSIELRHIHGKNVSDISVQEGREIKSMLDHYGICVSSIGSPLGKIRLDSDMNAHIEKAKHLYELAELLETRYVRVFSFYPPEGQDISSMKSRVVDALGELVFASRDFSLTLCHENEAGIYGDTPEQCRELIDAFGGELKCVFDMGNYVLENIQPYPYAYELLWRDIAYFHIKDALYAGAVVPPGKGEAAIRDILTEHAARADADFYVSLEPHLQTFSGFNALVSRSFDNPYKYEDTMSAFTDAVVKFRELMNI